MKARRIELKEPSEGFQYQKAAIMIVGAPELTPQGVVAMNYAELVRRGDLADELEKAEGAALISEDHYKLLMKLVRAFNWSAVTTTGNLSKSLLDTVRMFVTDLENAPVVEVDETVKVS